MCVFVLGFCGRTMRTIKATLLAVDIRVDAISPASYGLIETTIYTHSHSSAAHIHVYVSFLVGQYVQLSAVVSLYFDERYIQRPIAKYARNDRNIGDPSEMTTMSLSSKQSALAASVRAMKLFCLFRALYHQ